MKEYKNRNFEDAEYGVDSRYKNKKEQEKDSIVLMHARINRMKNLTKEQILRANQMQLKLKIEK